MAQDTSSQSYLDVDNHKLLPCERLPTPVHFDRASRTLLSPPLSRASSPLLLDLNTASGASSNIVSPLPSPISHPETRQAGKKTSAFFSSPFDRATPSPPPAPQRRASSCNARSPSPPLSSTGHIVLEPQRDQTANSSFFFAKGSATPTPPPSVHSSVDDGPISPPKLPPLARFFPSRASVDPDPDLLEDPGRLTSSPPAIQTSFQRDFLTIDNFQSISSSSSDLATPDSPTPKSEVPQSNLLLDKQLHHGSVASDSTQLTEGTIVGADVPLRLIRELGQGAFSLVWLALDMDHKLEQPNITLRQRSESIARRKGDRAMHGLRPLPAASPGSSLSRSQSLYFVERDGEGATSSGIVLASCEDSDKDHDYERGNLVAVKMMDRALCDANDRTRISFVREVEVLRHISHPSIVSYLHSFTTVTHHCLVLEALQGGELFELLDQGNNHNRMTGPLLRRIFGELCQAVGWMHGVCLVHRDLKLENILLTANPFLTSASSPITLSALPSPLVKLTDFGLARFIDPASPTLVTRCGSESYAAPEIVTGRPYDGRQTDAWACGIVLYALATRALPFDRIGGDRDTRRSYLMRIAQGEYTWPEPEARLATEGLKNVVARLLVRDASKRARVVELWDEPWMRGEGSPTPPLSKTGSVPVDSTGHLVGKDIPSVAKQEL